MVRRRQVSDLLWWRYSLKNLGENSGGSDCGLRDVASLGCGLVMGDGFMADEREDANISLNQALECLWTLRTVPGPMDTHELYITLHDSAAE
jgi:hypothetical protein